MCIAPLHDQFASLGRHEQLTRCFSAVAELLVLLVLIKSDVFILCLSLFSVIYVCR